MPKEPTKEELLHKMHAETQDEVWRKILIEGDPMGKRMRHIFRALPANPRCAQCNVPFAGVGGMLATLIGAGKRSAKNPRFCDACMTFDTKVPGGAEVELSMMFVDVRGSTSLAENMSALEFSRLMNRFYEVTINVLIKADAFIDKLVGDEVTALFFPGYAGKEHAQKAVGAGKAVLHATGHADAGGPWVPVGVGVHTGIAWVGSIVGASGASADFTALGDNVNIAARLASKAGAGEILASEATCRAAGLDMDSYEKRDLELKGKSATVGVRVLKAS